MSEDARRLEAARDHLFEAERLLELVEYETRERVIYEDAAKLRRHVAGARCAAARLRDWARAASLVRS